MEKPGKDVPVSALPDTTAYRPEQDSRLQRASIRKTVACIVQLQHGANLILTRKAENLNLTGIFVEMDTQGVVVGDYFEVWIGAESAHQKSLELTLPADVVRVEGRGIALKFRPYPGNAYTALVNLLYAW